MIEVEHLVEPAQLRSHAGGGVPDAFGMFAPNPAAEESLQGAIGAMGQLVINASTKIAHKTGVAKVDSMITNGDAADEILRCAERAEADLIVIGSRGLGDLKGLLMGSGQPAGQLRLHHGQVGLESLSSARISSSSTKVSG